MKGLLANFEGHFHGSTDGVFAGKMANSEFSMLMIIEAGLKSRSSVLKGCWFLLHNDSPAHSAVVVKYFLANCSLVEISTHLIHLMSCKLLRAISYEWKRPSKGTNVHVALVLSPFCFNARYHYTPLRNLATLIFSSCPFVWMSCVTPHPVCFIVIIQDYHIFIYTLFIYPYFFRSTAGP
jgi:hypothetical protein